MTVNVAYLAGANHPTNCSFARHFVGKMAIRCSFAHQKKHQPGTVGSEFVSQNCRCDSFASCHFLQSNSQSQYPTITKTYPVCAGTKDHNRFKESLSDHSMSICEVSFFFPDKIWFTRWDLFSITALIATPPKMDMSLKKGQFEKESSPPTSIFEGIS